jgi:predicted ATPase/class 3 adenylate cyclase
VAERITFLLTDVEGSTKLWEREPEPMSAALIRHDELIGGVIADHGGTLVKSKGEGDSTFSIFSDPSAAIAAALEVQLVLQREAWKTSKPIRVRAALHTGEAEPRDGDWYGPTVNRCARLRGAGHGGQVLLSSATRALVERALPAGASLRDLGVRRLKDLSEPQRVFQLVHPDVPASFPPLVTLDARQHNLPVQPTELVGREIETHEVREQLRGDARMVTLTGPGGVGKTRLALAVAAECIDDFTDGAWFVPLAVLDDWQLVPAALAHALGVTEPPDGHIAAAVIDHLRDREALLVLDNFEHVTDGALFVSDLLGSCAGVRVLATSREWLFLRGERDYPVPPLGSDEAVDLFGRRAGAADPGFRIRPTNAADVAELCERLDRLPLAIELVAARVREAPLDSLLAEFPLELATVGPRDLPARQRTLRHAIGWSYDLLSEHEQRVLRVLGTFTGGCEPTAASAVAGEEVATVATALADKSLVRIEPDEVGGWRYTTLTTVRDFAREQADVVDETPTWAERHAHYFDAYATAADTALAAGNEPQWLARLEADHPNFRQALTWSEHDVDLGLRLAGHLARFWWQQGHWHEARQWYDTVLERDGGTDEARASALFGAGYLAGLQGDLVLAESLLDECCALATTNNDEEMIARTFMVRGELLSRSDPSRAEAACREAVSRFEGVGSDSGLAMALNNLGRIAFQAGRLDDATAHYERALSLHEATGNARGSVTVSTNLASVALNRGDAEDAERRLRRNLEIARQFGDSTVVVTLINLGVAIGRQGRPQEAASLFAEGAAISREIGDVLLTRQALDYAFGVAMMQGDFPSARQAAEESRLISARLHDARAEAVSYALLTAASLEQGDESASDRYIDDALAAGRDANDSCYAAFIVTNGASDAGLSRALAALAEIRAFEDPQLATQLLAAGVVRARAREQSGGLASLADSLRRALGEEAFAAAWKAGAAASREELAAAASAIPAEAGGSR